MQKIGNDVKLILYVKNNDKKKFILTWGLFQLGLFTILLILMGLLSQVIDHEAANYFAVNTFIRIFIWIIATLISSYFLWKGCQEIIKQPEKSNKKAKWLVILAMGVFSSGVMLPIFMTDYVDSSLGSIIFKHLFIMISFGVFSGFITGWEGRNFEQIKEELNKSDS